MRLINETTRIEFILFLNNLMQFRDIFNDSKIHGKFDLKEIICIFLGISNQSLNLNLKSAFLEFFGSFFLEIKLENLGDFFEYFGDFLDILFEEMRDNCDNPGYVSLIIKVLGALNVKGTENAFIGNGKNELIEHIARIMGAGDLLFDLKENQKESEREIIEDLLNNAQNCLDHL